MKPLHYVAAITACTDYMRMEAWRGDALHYLDIRTRLIDFVRIACVDLVACEQRYTTNYAMKQYWMSVNTSELEFQPRGSSDHSYGTAFEANYRGLFRQQYLESLPLDLCVDLYVY